jgi:regulator of RNase E activity RraB
MFLFFVVFYVFFAVNAQDKDNKKDQKKEDKKVEKNLIEKQILENDNKLVAFYKQAKVDSLINMYSTNCYYIMEYKVRIDGRDELEKKLTSDFKAGFKILEMALLPDDHKVYGDMVLEVGVLTIKYISPSTKEIFNEKNNYLILWKKSTDNKFRIRSEMRNLIENPHK